MTGTIKCDNPTCSCHDTPALPPKRWCFEHGEKALDGSQASGATRYIDDRATGYAMEISVKDGRLFLVQWNEGGSAQVRELPDNMAIFVKLRERKDYET